MAKKEGVTAEERKALREWTWEKRNGRTSPHEDEAELLARFAETVKRAIGGTVGKMAPRA